MEKNKMKCNNCNNSIKIGQKFCQKCGTQISYEENKESTDRKNTQEVNIQEQIKELEKDEKLNLTIVLVTANLIATPMTIAMLYPFILISLITILLMNIFLIFFMKKYFENKKKIVKNIPNIQYEKKEIIKDVKSNNEIYKFNYALYIDKMKKKIIPLKILKVSTIIITILFIFLFIKNYNNELSILFFILMFTIPMAMIFIISAYSLEINDFINDTFLLDIVKTNNRLLLIKARPLGSYNYQKMLEVQGSRAKKTFNYTISSTVLPSPLDILATVNLITSLPRIYSNGEYEEKVIENIIDIDKEEKLIEILESENNEYKIEPFINPSIIENNDRYFIIKGTIKKDNGEEVIEKRKIYKLFDKDIEL